MGAALTHLQEPLQEKVTEDGVVPTRARYGACGMQGWRRGMEDAHVAVPDLDGTGRVSLFGVFDGHGGRGVARYAAKHLPDLVKSAEGYSTCEYGQALREAFFAVDEGLRTEAGRLETEQLDSSTTPCSARRVPIRLPRRVAQRIKQSDLLCAAEQQASLQPELSERGGGAKASNAEGHTPDHPSYVAASAEAETAVAGSSVSEAICATSAEAEADSDASDVLEESEEKSEESGDNDSEVVEIDPSLLKDPTPEGQGCTAVVALVVWGDDGNGADGARLVVANAGDSRCVLCCGPAGAVAMSEDHTPELESEAKRIEAAGGFVKKMPGGARVQGDLNLSRALGDLRYKQNKDLPPGEQIVTAEPEIMERVLEAEDRLLVLGCDGIWECNENESLAQELQSRMAGAGERLSLSRVCGEVCDWSLCSSMDPDENPGFDGTGCDNMTIVIVELERAGRQESDEAPLKRARIQ